MIFQVCDVKGPLGSVRKMCGAGNQVLFDDDGSYIRNKFTGVQTPIIYDKGAYYLDIWVKKGGFNGQE